jgi:hypothetical protein
MLLMTLPDPHEDPVSERVGDELVLAHHGTSEIFVRNPTGARFWKLLIERAFAHQRLTQL